MKNRNEITGDKIISKKTSKKFDDNYDRIKFKDETETSVKYRFERADKFWTLEFPSKHCAIKHAKLNLADKVYNNDGELLCERIVLNECIKAYKVY